MSKKSGKENSPITLHQCDQSIGDLLRRQKRLNTDYKLGGPDRDLLTLNLQSLEQSGVQWGDELAILTTRGGLRLLGLLETGWDENGSLVFGLCNSDGSLVNGLNHSPARISGSQERVERVFQEIGNVFKRLQET